MAESRVDDNELHRQAHQAQETALRGCRVMALGEQQIPNRRWWTPEFWYWRGRWAGLLGRPALGKLSFRFLPATFRRRYALGYASGYDELRMLADAAFRIAIDMGWTKMDVVGGPICTCGHARSFHVSSRRTYGERTFERGNCCALLHPLGPDIPGARCECEQFQPVSVLILTKVGPSPGGQATPNSVTPSEAYTYVGFLCGIVICLWAWMGRSLASAYRALSVIVFWSILITLSSAVSSIRIVGWQVILSRLYYLSVGMTVCLFIVWFLWSVYNAVKSWWNARYVDAGLVSHIIVALTVATNLSLFPQNLNQRTHLLQAVESVALTFEYALPRRLRTYEVGADERMRDWGSGVAAHVRSLKKGIMLPTPDGHSHVIVSLVRILDCVLRAAWGELDIRPYKKNVRVVGRVYGVVARLLWAIVPVTIAAAISQAHLPILAPISGFVMTATVLWALVSIAMMDPWYGNKFDAIIQLKSIKPGA